MKRLAISARRIFGFGVAVVAASCAGDGCGCTEPTPGGFPSAERTENAIQVRVTPTGLAAVEADPAALVGSFLGTENGAFPLPATCGGDPEICCDNGQPVDPCGPVLLDFEPQAGDAPRLEINPTNGTGHVQVITRMRIRTGMDIPVSTAGTDCEISIDTTASGNDSVEIVLDIDLLVDPVTQTTAIANTNASVNDLNNGDLDLDGGFLCELADALLIGTVRGELEDALEGILEETLTELSCKQCPSGDVSDCGEFGESCTDGVCQRGGGCLQELGLAGRVVADKAFAGFSSGQLGKMDMYEVAGGYSETTTGGVSLGVMSGAIPAATERDRCGPSGTAPALQTTLPRSAFFSGNTRPDTGNPFGVGIGLHQYNLDLFAYSMYESGLLCLNIGPSAVDLLTAETFSLVMPSLLSLANNQPAPVTLGLRPQNQPILTLGLGTTSEGGDIDEPLINLEMPGLEIDFFAMIDDQHIRVMTLGTDLTLPINLEADEMGSLTPVIGATDNAFANLVVLNSEALTESPQELADRFPALLDLALPMLAGGLNIDLPLLGSLELKVQPDGITAVEAKSILAIFADLAVVDPNARRERGVTTSARIIDLRVPHRAAFFAPSQNTDVRPQVTVELGGTSPTGAELEWSYRLNEGLWSTYSRARTRVIESNVLWLQGRHELEVRAREVGKGHTTDPHPVSLAVPVDRVGPRLRTMRGFADQILVSARDYVEQGPLTIEYQLAGRGEWRQIENVPQGALVAIDLENTRMEDVLVRALDSSGNLSHGPRGELIEFHGSGDSAGCECDSSGGGAGTLALILVASLLAFASRRRRVLEALSKLGVCLALITLASTFAACSCGGSGECDDDDPDCEQVERGPTGRYLSSAQNSDRTVLAAYDSELGDLVLIDVADDGKLRYRVADGIPDGVPPSFDTDTYRGGVAAPGPDVGAWTSVALEGGDARLSYQDLDTQQLKFASQSGDSFSSHYVDGLEGEKVGFYSSLAIRGGAPSIAYMAIGADGPDGTKLSQLRMATASSESPSSSDSWTVTVVDETTISCAGLCGDSLACLEADSAIGPACLADTGDCPEACGEDEACVGAICHDILAVPPVVDLPLGTGLFANNLTLADGRAAIVFYRRYSGDLVVAVENAGAWEVTDLDAAEGTNTGAFATATLGADGLVHIAYQDAIGDRVLYLAWDGTAVVAGPEFVDDGVRSGDVRAHPVGAGMSIAQRGSNIAIAYQDGLTSDLVVATGSAGAWNVSDSITGATLEGFYNRFVGSFLATYSYDRAEPDPGDIVLVESP